MTERRDLRVLAPFPARDVEALAEAATREGFRFVRRLIDEYGSGRIRFDRPGEVLLGVYDGPELIAVGGVSHDPYGGDASVGRVRHVYVHPAHRRGGVGRALVAALETHARGRFRALVLRTDTDRAARFYAALEYRLLPPGGTATHRRELGPG